MKSMLLLFCTAFLISLSSVKCQWIVHNITNHVINTTYGQNPGYPYYGGPQQHFNNNYQPSPAFVRNITNFVGNHGNGLMIGNPGPYDVVLFNQVYRKPARWLQIREKTIEYPTFPVHVNNRKIITAIHIFDMSNAPGGLANIISGGVGFTHVSVRLFSERSKGFHFKLVIYGK